MEGFSQGSDSKMVAQTPEELIFTQPSQFSDVTLVVEGKRLYSSRYVLSLMSPKFCKMFTADIKKEKSKEMELSEKSYRDVLDLLLFTRPFSEKKLTGDLAVRIYPLCHEYEMTREKQRCIQAILEAFKKELKQQDPDSARLHRASVQLACEYDLLELYKVCVDVAIDHPASHYDALIDNMKNTPAEFQTVFATKLKRTTYDHRNGREFRLRFKRPCEEYTDPSKCVDYTHAYWYEGRERKPAGF